jgi:hypothetical protein
MLYLLTLHYKYGMESVYRPEVDLRICIILSYETLLFQEADFCIYISITECGWVLPDRSSLRGQCHEMFRLRFFHQTSPGPNRHV